VLVTVLIAPPLTAAAFRPLRTRPAVNDHTATPPTTRLAVDVDCARDHVRGRPDAPVTVVAYLSYGCESCAEAASTLRQVQQSAPEAVRYVVRHVPLAGVAVDAGFGAEMLEAAAAQDAYWPMFDGLFEHGEPATLIGADRTGVCLGLDLDRFFTHLSDRPGRTQIDGDIRSADASGVTATPALFVDGDAWSGPIATDALQSVGSGAPRHWQRERLSPLGRWCRSAPR
jgi:protein-disulfide isomerase